MKKIKLLVSILCMIAMTSTTAFGMTSNESLPKIQTSMVLTNNETGESIEVPMTCVGVERISPQTRAANGVETFKVEYSANIDIPNEEGSIMPLGDLKNEDDEGSHSYMGRVELEYDRYFNSAKNDYALLLTKFTGSWRQIDSAVWITNQTYSYATTSGDQNTNGQSVLGRSFSGSITKYTGFKVPVYENEYTAICGGEVAADFERNAGSSWHGIVKCYVVHS